MAGIRGELPDLLDLLPSRPGPDPGAFAQMLGTGGLAPSGQTPFEGVTRLRPGRFVELTRRSVETRRYWTPRYRRAAKGSRAEHVEALREVIDRAVRRRMSEVSTAVVLSGGVDSSVVTAVASQMKPPDSSLQTYSAVFPDYPEVDEGWKVRSLTSSLGIEPAAFELAPRGALWLSLQHAKRWGLPLSGAGAVIDMAMVAEAARDGAEVILEGQGGDETFGFSPYLVSDRLRRGRLLAALELSRQWPLGHPPTSEERRFVLTQVGLKGALPHGKEHRRREALKAPAWLLPQARDRYLELKDPWEWKTGASGPRWWRYLADLTVEMPHRVFRLDYLRHRAASVGTVAESPLYDFDLIDHCLGLPPELAFNYSHNRPLAREAMRGLIPDDVRLDGQKSNLSLFCFDILTGEDAPGIERLLTAPDAELGAYVDMDLVRRRWHERPARDRAKTMSWGSQIWAWATAECWLRAQANPDFVDQMLDRPDVRPPSMRKAVPNGTGTFSRLADAEERVYGDGTHRSRPIQEPHV